VRIMVDHGWHAFYLAYLVDAARSISAVTAQRKSSPPAWKTPSSARSSFRRRRDSLTAGTRGATAGPSRDRSGT
jgi:hypothetical protein